MKVIAVLRSGAEKVQLAIYADGERTDIDREVFAERIGLQGKETPTGKAQTVELTYHGASQYYATFAGIADTLKYLAPFQDKGHSIHLLTNQNTVVRQLTGQWKTNDPEHIRLKKIIVALNTHPNKATLQAISPERALAGVALA